MQKSPQMAAHRDNPACASCHRMMDPLGFALENYDAVGRWRTSDGAGLPIDATGKMPDGREFRNATELQRALTAISFEIKTEIRFIPNEAGKLEPRMKAKVRPKKADKAGRANDEKAPVAEPEEPPDEEPPDEEPPVVPPPSSEESSSPPQAATVQAAVTTRLIAILENFMGCLPGEPVGQSPRRVTAGFSVQAAWKAGKSC